MDTSIREPMDLNSEELAVLAELLEAEHSRLLVEIRHTHHRAFRDDLSRRLAVVEKLEEHFRPETV